MEKYNLDKLVKVKVLDFYESSWYKYQSEYVKGGFWSEELKIGVHGKLHSMGFQGEEAPERHTIKDGVIYENPEVRLYFQSNIEHIKYFDTLEEANSFAESITKGKHWLLN